MSFDFSSDVRLKKKWQFDLVFRTGRREKGALVRLFFVESADSSTQIAMVVGRKIANAVGRSRGKRMLRESVRHLLPYVEKGYWIVLSARDRALTVKTQDVYRDVTRLLLRAQIIKSPPSVNPW